MGNFPLLPPQVILQKWTLLKLKINQNVRLESFLGENYEECQNDICGLKYKYTE